MSLSSPHPLWRGRQAPSRRYHPLVGSPRTPNQATRAGAFALLAPGIDAGWAFPHAASSTHRPIRIDPSTSSDPTADIAGTVAGGDWIGWLSYDLGRTIEPTIGAGQPAARDRDWPLAELFRCSPAPEAWPPSTSSGWMLGPLASNPGRDAFTAAVRAALHHIREGDIYQVNLAHRASAPFEGSARAFAADMLARESPWFGAYFEAPAEGPRPAHAIVSLSPELFLSFDARTRRIITRPMKGTRPATSPATDLARSAKDLAELTMIIDLMRNDLGRICEPGTVRVEHRRIIERHGAGAAGVWQAVGEVTGAVDRSATLADILRATFPAGSITGAPKISAMRIIDRLEPARRGPYCGAIGAFAADGSFTLSVAIRTAAITFNPGDEPAWGKGTLDYWAGAGIVADSDPDAEWEETLVKSRVLRAAHAHAPSGTAL